MTSISENVAAIQKCLQTLQAVSSMEILHNPALIGLPRTIAEQQYRKLNPSAYKPGIGPACPEPSYKGWVKK